MTPKPVINEAKVVIAILVVCAAFLAGFQVESWRADKRISQAETAAQKRYSDAATENLRKLVTAQETGDFLLARTTGLEETIRAFAEEKNHEIAKLTAGRACLGGAVVRVLNSTQGAGGRAGLVSQAAVDAVSAAAAVGQDPDQQGDFATDTDVAIWISQCQRGYETCRGRIQAINDFYEGLKID